MKLKLLALALFVGMLWWLAPTPYSKSSNPLAQAIDLTPASMGLFKRQDQTWRILRKDGSIEEGAMYALPDHPEASIQLDFYRQFNKEHNGLLCYLLQGETLVWTQTFVTYMHQQKITLLLGLTQSDNQLRLTAVTECYSDACIELDVSSAWTIKLAPDSPAATGTLARSNQASKGVVPMSVVITQPYAAGQAQHVEQQLVTVMHSFLKSFDFQTVMQLAEYQN